MRTAKACGPDPPMLSRCWDQVLRMMNREATVAKLTKPTPGRTPRRARISRKPLCREMPDHFGMPVVTNSRVFCLHTGFLPVRPAPGLPLCPLFRGGNVDARLGRYLRGGNAKLFPPLSCSASTGHPVRRGLSAQALLSLEYWVARSSRATTSEN